VRPRSSYTSRSPSIAGSESAASAALRGCAARDRTGRRLLSRPWWRGSKSWDDRVGELEQLADSPGFFSLREEIIALARLDANDRALDIGAGTGLLVLAAAPNVQHVTALDVSPAMCRHLEAKLARIPLANVDVVTGTAIDLPLAAGSVDVVLSNYCFHHLENADKRRALDEVSRVLRPGGRLVIGDMMFHVGLGDARDRALIARFVGRMLRRGPAGVLRLLKNSLRHVTGRGERPASVDWWRRALAEAGFADIAVRALEHEGGIAIARRSG
jgi:ubiquinone/menaquinone biosynthesis C-methylase UbiE